MCANRLDTAGWTRACASIGGVLWALVALAGAFGLSHTRGISLADACLALALVYLPSGAAWFVLARLGSQPLGFSRTTVLLTAVHFHFITLAALILTGLTGRAVGARHVGWPRTAYRVAAVFMRLDPLLVAPGIALTQVTGVRFPESTAAVLLALSLL